VEIAGQSYSKLTADMTMYGQTITQNYMFRKIDDRMAGFITTSTTDTAAELEILMQGFTKF